MGQISEGRGGCTPSHSVPGRRRASAAKRRGWNQARGPCARIPLPHTWHKSTRVAQLRELGGQGQRCPGGDQCDQCMIRGASDAETLSLQTSRHTPPMCNQQRAHTEAKMHAERPRKFEFVSDSFLPVLFKCNIACT